MERIQRELRVYSSLPVAEVAEQMGESLETVKEAARRLAASGTFRVDEIEGIGLVILVGTAKA
jgi:Mn-dependent DtxR family transcriptional regulator